MIYKVERNECYDYAGQSYSSMYPNLHRYPATMIPQIGIDILKEFDAQSGVMLDPYCGSGSSFICGLECGITEMHGFDLNPLAVLIAQAKFTKISSSVIEQSRDTLRENVFEILKDPRKIAAIAKPEITNINFWFSPAVIEHLAVLKHCIDNLSNKSVRTLFSVPFSETVRECSYTRNNEFKLYRIKPEEILAFNPDVMSFYFKKLDETIFYYKNFYLPKLTDETRVTVTPRAFENDGQEYDVVLTSPPYGDSRTTVAYGQFSTLSNEWLGIKEARKIDAKLMGGAKAERILSTGCMAEPLRAINAVDEKRALEVSAFYADLESSIQTSGRQCEEREARRFTSSGTAK